MLPPGNQISYLEIFWSYFMENDEEILTEVLVTPLVENLASRGLIKPYKEKCGDFTEGVEVPGFVSDYFANHNTVDNTQVKEMLFKTFSEKVVEFYVTYRTGNTDQD